MSPRRAPFGTRSDTRVPHAWPMLRLLVALAAWCLPLSSFAAITVDARTSPTPAAITRPASRGRTRGRGNQPHPDRGDLAPGKLDHQRCHLRRHRPEPDRNSLLQPGHHRAMVPVRATAGNRQCPRDAQRQRGGRRWGRHLLRHRPDDAPRHVRVRDGVEHDGVRDGDERAGELVVDTVAANGNAETPSRPPVGRPCSGIQVQAPPPPTSAAAAARRTGAASVVMSWTLGVSHRWVIGAVPLKPMPLSGTVFEDVNYGGGAGRDQATASGVGRCRRAGRAVRRRPGSFVSFTTTDASGNYSFGGIAAGNYTVRVVNSTVTSSRGAARRLLPVQTYRTNASTGTAVPVTNYVGGQNPAVADAGNGGAGTTMNTATGVFTAGISGTAQSITNATRRNGRCHRRRLRLQLRHDRQRERLGPGVAAAVHPQQQRPRQRGARHRGPAGGPRRVRVHDQRRLGASGPARGTADRQPAHRGAESRRDHARDRLCPP